MCLAGPWHRTVGAWRYLVKISYIHTYVRNLKIISLLEILEEEKDEGSSFVAKRAFLSRQQITHSFMCDPGWLMRSHTPHQYLPKGTYSGRCRLASRIDAMTTHNIFSIIYIYCRVYYAGLVERRDPKAGRSKDVTPLRVERVYIICILCVLHSISSTLFVSRFICW